MTPGEFLAYLEGKASTLQNDRGGDVRAGFSRQAAAECAFESIQHGGNVHSRSLTLQRLSVLIEQLLLGISVLIWQELDDNLDNTGGVY